MGQIFVQYAGGKMEHYELQESDLGAETLGLFILFDYYDMN